MTRPPHSPNLASIKRAVEALHRCPCALDSALNTDRADVVDATVYVFRLISGGLVYGWRTVGPASAGGVESLVIASGPPE